MFLGHAVLAAGLAALVVRARGGSPERALSVATIAGLFATAPDVDIVYALPGLMAADGLMGAPDAFWTASTAVHRGVTHSLLLAIPAAIVVTLSGRSIWKAGMLGLGLCGMILATAGSLPTAIFTAFLLLGGAITAVANRIDLDERSVLGAALLAFLTHPFGDLLTGTPPPLLFPLETTVLGGRITPFVDPTLNLLLAFLVELGVLWFGIWALARTADVALRPALNRRALLGATIAVPALVLTPPTMAASVHFVLPALAVGLVGVLPQRLPPGSSVGPLPALVTGLAAITVGVSAYTLAYLVV